jgi:polysaccharide export outer membrane protein
MNVFAAISSAGGISRRGRPKHIAVVRMVNDELTMRTVNLDAFIRKQDINQNVALLDGDMIFVPKSNKVIINEDIMPIVTLYGLYKTITGT